MAAAARVSMPMRLPGPRPASSDLAPPWLTSSPPSCFGAGSWANAGAAFQGASNAPSGAAAGAAASAAAGAAGAGAWLGRLWTGSVRRLLHASLPVEQQVQMSMPQTLH